jgi:hypothetical protein
MPKLTETTQAMRVEQAIEVYTLMAENSKLTQAAACAIVGISPKTFRFWIAQSHEAIEQFREMMSRVERLELAKVITAREAILDMTIKDGLSRFTDPLSRLAILTYLHQLGDELGERHRSVIDEDTRALLSGPNLVPGQSRFAPGTEIELDVTRNSDGGVTVHPILPQVLDLEHTDSQ